MLGSSAPIPCLIPKMSGTRISPAFFSLTSKSPNSKGHPQLWRNNFLPGPLHLQLAWTHSPNLSLRSDQHCRRGSSLENPGTGRITPRFLADKAGQGQSLSLGLGLRTKTVAGCRGQVNWALFSRAHIRTTTNILVKPLPCDLADTLLGDLHNCPATH